MLNPLVAMSLVASHGLAGANLAQMRVPDYASDVAPILNRRCVSCHSESQVAPFSLVGYKQAYRFSKTIAVVTGKRYMPPWKANLAYGEFKDVPVLTDEEISTLKLWADSGAPEGDPSKVPASPPVTAGWRLGTPDLVLRADRATRIPAEGRDFYRNYLVDPHVTKPTWVRAVEFRPSGRNTVHHVIPAVIGKEDAEKCRKIKFDHDDNSWDLNTTSEIDADKTLGFWSTGAPPFFAPENTAFLLKPGDCFLLNMHFKPTGKIETEQTQVGLYYLEKAPAQELKVLSIEAEGSIYIEPGRADQRFYMSDVVGKETTVFAIWPHMHYLGRTFKAWVKYPAGFSKPLVCINDWDPEWQLLYYLKTPMVLPKGSKIYVTGTYDNTSNNVRNPFSPPQLIESGQSSKDEMLLCTLYVTQRQNPPAQKKDE